MIHKEKTDWLLPALLTRRFGAVDVIGFLALGVFMAHITGNLVILAAHYVTGRFGEIGPILSVPVFMLVLSLVTLALVEVPARIARRVSFSRRSCLQRSSVLALSLVRSQILTVEWLCW